MNDNSSNNESMHRFNRDGHLSELGAERYVSGELLSDKKISEHLKICCNCQTLVDDVTAARTLFSIVPSFEVMAANRPKHAEVSVGAFDRIKQWLTQPFGGAVALAAVVLLVVFVRKPQPQLEATPVVDPNGFEDSYRFKSGGLGFEVLVREPDGFRTETDDGNYRPGDQLRFRVHPREQGYLMVVGIDTSGTVYPCHPQSQGEAMLVEPSAQASILDSAIELDGAAQQERIVALLCDGPFDYAAVREKLEEKFIGVTLSNELEQLWPNCQQTEVRLTKGLN